MLSAKRWRVTGRHRHRPGRCGATSDTEAPIVVGIGGVGIDYLASVATYPNPDQKMRTERLEMQGGGNCGNALTGLSRLGVHARVLSGIGDDTLGDAVMAEFEQDGVDVQHLLRKAGESTPFTYIIVDRLGTVLFPLPSPNTVPSAPPPSRRPLTAAYAQGARARASTPPALACGPRTSPMSSPAACSLARRSPTLTAVSPKRPR